eukprot:scaffold101_cov230-Pinguiococcus_pyrenoidosus.AAC.1
MSLYSLGESTSSGTHDALRTVAAPLTVSPPSRLACEMCGRTRLVSARVSRNPSSFVTDSAAYDSHSITSTRLKRASTRMACSMMLMRYFIASGVDSAHRVFFACPSAKIRPRRPPGLGPLMGTPAMLSALEAKLAERSIQRSAKGRGKHRARQVEVSDLELVPLVSGNPMPLLPQPPGDLLITPMLQEASLSLSPAALPPVVRHAVVARQILPRKIRLGQAAKTRAARLAQMLEEQKGVRQARTEGLRAAVVPQ